MADRGCSGIRCSAESARLSKDPTRRSSWAWLLSWLLVTACFLFAFRGITWGDAVGLIREASWGWLALAMVANFAILPLAALRWMFFLPRSKSVEFPRMMWITVVTSAISNGGPFLAGHAAGIHLLATQGRTGYSTAVSVKAIEQLAEGIAKLSLFGLTLALAPLSGGLRGGGAGLLLVVSVFGCLLLVAAHRGHHLERLAVRLPARVRGLLSFASEVAVQMESLRRPLVFLVGVGLGLLQKVAEGFALFAVLAALGVSLPLWGILVVLSAVNLSTMASVTPANLGIYEASAVVAYGLIGLEPELMVGAAILQHAAYLIPMSGVGWVMMAFGGGRAIRSLARGRVAS